MTRLRPILLLLTLMMQTFAAYAPRASAAEVGCTMGCCAALAEGVLNHCSCVSDTDETPAPSPLPPPTQREVFSSLPAMPVNEIALPVMPARPLAILIAEWSAPSLLSPPHVRLPVLYCSLLT
jgi:hypothetical protein